MGFVGNTPYVDPAQETLLDRYSTAAHLLAELHDDSDVMTAIKKTDPVLAKSIRETVERWRAAGDAWLSSLPVVKT